MSRLSIGAVTESDPGNSNDFWNCHWAYTPEVSDDSLINDITGGHIPPIRNSWLDHLMEERERVRFLEEEERYAAAEAEGSQPGIGWRQRPETSEQARARVAEEEEILRHVDSTWVEEEEEGVEDA